MDHSEAASGNQGERSGENHTTLSDEQKYHSLERATSNQATAAPQPISVQPAYASTYITPYDSAQQISTSQKVGEAPTAAPPAAAPNRQLAEVGRVASLRQSLSERNLPSAGNRTSALAAGGISSPRQGSLSELRQQGQSNAAAQVKTTRSQAQLHGSTALGRDGSMKSARESRSGGLEEALTEIVSSVMGPAVAAPGSGSQRAVTTVANIPGGQTDANRSDIQLSFDRVAASTTAGDAPPSTLPRDPSNGRKIRSKQAPSTYENALDEMVASVMGATEEEPPRSKPANMNILASSLDALAISANTPAPAIHIRPASSAHAIEERAPAVAPIRTGTTDLLDENAAPPSPPIARTNLETLSPPTSSPAVQRIKSDEEPAAAIPRRPVSAGLTIQTTIEKMAKRISGVLTNLASSVDPNLGASDDAVSTSGSPSNSGPGASGARKKKTRSKKASKLVNANGEGSSDPEASPAELNNADLLSPVQEPTGSPSKSPRRKKTAGKEKDGGSPTTAKSPKKKTTRRFITYDDEDVQEELEQGRADAKTNQSKPVEGGDFETMFDKLADELHKKKVAIEDGTKTSGSNPEEPEVDDYEYYSYGSDSEDEGNLNLIDYDYYSSDVDSADEEHRYSPWTTRGGEATKTAVFEMEAAEMNARRRSRRPSLMTGENKSATIGGRLKGLTRTPSVLKEADSTGSGLGAPGAASGSPPATSNNLLQVSDAVRGGRERRGSSPDISAGAVKKGLAPQAQRSLLFQSESGRMCSRSSKKMRRRRPAILQPLQTEELDLFARGRVATLGPVSTPVPKENAGLALLNTRRPVISKGRRGLRRNNEQQLGGNLGTRGLNVAQKPENVVPEGPPPEYQERFDAVDEKAAVVTVKAKKNKEIIAKLKKPREDQKKKEAREKLTVTKALLDPSIRKQALKLKIHEPYFTYFIAIVNLGMLVYTFVFAWQKGGTILSSNPINPMIGPSSDILVRMGARFVPCMRYTDALPPTAAIPCPKGLVPSNPTASSTTTCSLEDYCGIAPFGTANVPDQWYRLFIPMFLHAGVLHLVGTNWLLYQVLYPMEQAYGWLRIGFVYLMSGVGGFLMTVFFTQLSPSVGASGSVFGVLACVLLDLFLNFKIVKNRWWELVKILFTIAITFVLGLLPYVDNFAHLGGFVFGLLTGILVLPSIDFGPWNRRWKAAIRGIAIPILLMLIGFLLLDFYSRTTVTCAACKYVDCFPVLGWCDNYG